MIIALLTSTFIFCFAVLSWQNRRIKIYKEIIRLQDEYIKEKHKVIDLIIIQALEAQIPKLVQSEKYEDVIKVKEMISTLKSINYDNHTI